MSFTEHFNLPKAGAAGALNKWATYDAGFDAIEAGRTIKRTAAASITKGQAVYLNASSQFALANNGNRPLAGLAIADIASAADGYARMEGILDYASWAWTPHAPVYVHGSTAGLLTQTKPTGFAPAIAWALSATKLWLLRSGFDARRDEYAPAIKVPIVLDAKDAIVMASGAAAHAKTDGTNWPEWRLSYDDTTAEAAYWKTYVPDRYIGTAIDVLFMWRCGATTGNVKWDLKWLDRGDDAVYDAALTTIGNVTDAAKGNANRLNFATLAVASNLPTAGRDWIIEVKRDPAVGSDLTGDAHLLKVVLLLDIQAP